MKLIGLSGKIGTGKSTVASEIAKATGFKKISLADNLKEEVAEVFGVPLHHCYGHKAWIWPVEDRYFVDGDVFYPPSKDSMSVRAILQWYGTDVRRKQDPNYWLKIMQKKLDDLSFCGAKGVIIDDVRFLSEAEFVKNNGGSLFRLCPYPGWECDKEAAKHTSETELDKYEQWDAAYCPTYGNLKIIAEDIMEEMQICLPKR